MECCKAVFLFLGRRRCGGELECVSWSEGTRVVEWEMRVVREKMRVMEWEMRVVE